MTRIKFKISNWNVERPQFGTKITKAVISKIQELDSDIIVLTETSDAIDLSREFPHSIKTEPWDLTPNEQWVTIWSKWKILEKIKTFDDHRTASAVIATLFGKIIVFGTIIPYHMAGVSGKRYGNLGYKPWEFHEKDLIRQGEEWEKLSVRNIPLFVIGDFNQSRYNGQGYGTKKVRDILTGILTDLNLTCVTEIDFSGNYLTEDPKNGRMRNNIDHICISNSFINKMNNLKVGAWNHFTESGLYMSDHNGVFVEFEINPNQMISMATPI